MPRTSDTAICDSAQDTHAWGVVNVEVCVVGTGIPTGEMVEQVVRERGSGAAGGTAVVDLPYLVGADRLLKL